MTAVFALIETEKWLPSIADIKKRIKRIESLSPVMEWEEVVQAMRLHGGYYGQSEVLKAL